MEEVIAHVVQPINWIDVVTFACSVITSLAAIIISIITYRSQKTHNKNSVRPILSIVIGDYEDDLYVRVYNCGVGPATITETCFKKGEEVSKCKCLVELIPPSAIVIQKDRKSEEVDLSTYTDFSEDIKGRTIPPNQNIVLFQVKNPTEDKRLALRNFLKDCEVKVCYTDIYNSNPWICERKLDFFGRTLVAEMAEIIY